MILEVLVSLETLATRAGGGGALEITDARDVIHFLRTFADKLHHGKEEAELFPAMLGAGFPSEGGPVDVMLHEHEQGRACVRAMAEAVTAAENGEPGAGVRFAEPALAFVGLLREHIEKEDHCLFSMAENAFDDEATACLRASFERYDGLDDNRRDAEECRQIAKKLAERYPRLAAA